MEKSVSRRAHNPKAAGSSPAPATKSKKPQHFVEVFLCLISCFMVSDILVNLEKLKSQHLC